MKVLLISMNRETEPFTAAPLGLASVAAALMKAGHEVRAVDLLFSADPVRDIEGALDGFEPGLVGLSLRNIESSTEFLLPSYKELVVSIKGLCSAPIVVGGPGFSIMPIQALEYLGLEVGIVGEGERAAVELCRTLEAGGDLSGVRGLCTLNGGRYSVTPPEPIAGLGANPFPSWELFPVSRYDMVGVQSKRGCSFGCVYCTYPNLEGRAMRLRPPGLVAEEMGMALERHGRKSFYFVDNVFNNPREHAEGICKAISARGLDIEWGCLASPLGLDGRLAGLMSGAGCVSVEIGADSLSDMMLKRLRKSFTADDVRMSVKACKDAGMMHMVFIILGGPGEDRDTLRETFDALDEISPDKVFAVAGIRVYPGTPLAAMAVDEGLISPDDGLLTPAFYVSDRLGEGLYELAGEYFERHPDWIYYQARGVLGGVKKKPPDGSVSWDGGAVQCLENVLEAVPRLLRPIAEKAVKRKANALALSRGLATVRAGDVRDAFLSETPGPFQGRMKERLRKLGLLDG